MLHVKQAKKLKLNQAQIGQAALSAVEGDKSDPDYPKKWSDDNKQQRLRLDRGHIDQKTGLPYENSNASVDHAHAYDSNGNSIVNPETVDKHFPISGD